MSNVNRELEALEAEIERLQSLCNELNEELFSANMTIANYETEKENRWISVKERLPEEEGEYLVFYKYKENEDRVDIALFSRFGWHKAYEITHWQPLPEPPKGDDNE